MARSMPVSTSCCPYVLRRPSILSSGEAVSSPNSDVIPRIRPCSRRVCRTASQSANRATGTVTTMKKHAATTYGVKLKSLLDRTCAARKASTTPMTETRAVSFCSETKSLSSGGITRRSPCGRTTNRIDCR